MSKELLNFLVVRDYDGHHHVWSKERYEKYIQGCVNVGAGSAYKIITCFNGDEDYLMHDHLPISREQADASVLVQALEGLINEFSGLAKQYIDFSNKAYSEMNVKAADMWTHKKDGLTRAEIEIRMILNRYKESKPSSSITREWINIQDRLPEPKQKVDLWLVFKDKKPVRIIWTWEKQDNQNTTIEEGKITHWMPFLEPTT